MTGGFCCLNQEAIRRRGLSRLWRDQAEKRPGRKDEHRKPLLPRLTGS